MLPEYLPCGDYCCDKLSGICVLYGQHCNAKPIRLSVSIQATSNRHWMIIHNFKFYEKGKQRKDILRILTL